MYFCVCVRMCVCEGVQVNQQMEHIEQMEIQVRVCVCTSISVCAYVCIFLCLCLCERDRKRQRETERECVSVCVCGVLSVTSQAPITPHASSHHLISSTTTHQHTYTSSAVQVELRTHNFFSNPLFFSNP